MKGNRFVAKVTARRPRGLVGAVDDSGAASSSFNPNAALAPVDEGDELNVGDYEVMQVDEPGSDALAFDPDDLE